jgi:hypothetical protein
LGRVIVPMIINFIKRHKKAIVVITIIIVCVIVAWAMLSFLLEDWLSGQWVIPAQNGSEIS